MASPNPAPSRAAINALRGVLLTTSCSVIILAEERRRRLNIARAAIDNAKKLHTARVHHNSAALAESYGRREAFPVEIAHDFNAVPAPKNSVRRRRRRIDSPKSDGSESKEVGSIDKFKTTLNQDSNTAQARQTRWDEWDVSRKESSRISDISSFTRIPPLLRISADDDLPNTKLPHSGWKPRTPNARRAQELDSLNVVHQHVSSEAASVKPSSRSQDASAEETTRKLSRKSSDGPFGDLDALLAKLESPASTRSQIVEQQEKCAGMLQELIKPGFEEPQAVFSRGIRLLQSTASSKEYSNVPLILDTISPVCKDLYLLAVPFMDRLLQTSDKEGVRHLVKGFSRLQDQRPEGASYKYRNEWVTGFLTHYWKTTKDFSRVKEIYATLQECGMSSFTAARQYAIRRRLTLIALDAGDDTTAAEGLVRLQELKPKLADADVKLRGRFVVRDAELGLWDIVWTRLDTFFNKDKPSPAFQNVLSWLTRIYCQDHSPAEIDIFVRDLISVHRMALSKTLAFAVLDRHGRNRDLKALVAWLEFCQDGGLEMDQIFFNEVADKSCKYWNLTRVDLLHMLKDLQASMPWLHDPLLARYKANGALHDLHMPLPGEQGDGYAIVSTLPDCGGDSTPIFERTVFKYMNTLALQEEWGRVYNTYQEAVDKGLGCSARCLRLAVVANIHLEGPRSRTASELISKAHEEKHDISGALVPMLVSRLECGDDVGNLLQETLSKGQRVHDSVYNKAVRVLMQKGRQEAAIKVCEVAAETNGMGELAYNKFNFSSLVYAYTGQRRYEDLQSLVTSFTSKSDWWQASKECKESIKLAIKTIAGRKARDGAVNTEREEALLCLDDALQHIKSLRATNRQERETLKKEVVSVFGMAEQPPAFDGGFFPDTQVERQTPKTKRSIVRDATTSRETTLQPEETRQEDDGLATSNGAKDTRTEQRSRPRRERTPSPEMSEQEKAYLERQSLAGAWF
ncbi:hypothetical protein LCI18_008561 [Fusarium solani-melongenae]|uniref:Uncharacterized protein n=1 Tax=Fusarium solani subsp. cucurbitae TaxID=2747967 RepID=A0ACD3Z9U9_FUSSC|nr:hypothetical protein LCI18_008561 [Fusarium solani-melongenae]